MSMDIASNRRWTSSAAALTLTALLGACGPTFDKEGAVAEEEEEGPEFESEGQPLTCGVERWSVKTGTDADAGSVNQTSVTTAISTLVGYGRPGSLPTNNRVGPVELTTYRLRNVTMTQYKTETDGDYHIVLSLNGQTLIAEMPNTGCVGGTSPFASKISAARSAFTAKYTPTTSFKSSSDTVTVVGVGFWDFLHGQTGVAPNGIELHPVTFFCSGLNC